MNRLRNIVVLTGLLLLTTTHLTAFAGSNKIKPGLWETTIAVKMIDGPAGMPAMPPHTERRCVKANDLDELTPEPGAGKCDVKKHQKSANTMSWTVKCNQNGMVSTGHGESTFSDNSNKGFFEVKMTGGHMGPMKMKTTFESHRLGGC